MSTAYRPQTDGTTECFSQEIEAYISIYCSSHPETWHKKIGTRNNGIHPQQSKTCRQDKDILRTHSWIIPSCYSNFFRKHQIPISRRKDPEPYKRPGRSSSHTRTCQNKDGNATTEQIYTIQTRTTSLA